MHQLAGACTWPLRALVAVALALHVVLAVALLPDSPLLSHVAQAVELMTYPVLLAGAGLLYAHHRLSPERRTGWLCVAAMFGSAQGLGYAALRVSMDDLVVHHLVGLGVVDVVVASMLLVMLAASPTARQPSAPLLLGVMLAVLVTSMRVVVVSGQHLEPLELDARPVPPALVLALYAVAALLVWRRVPVPAWAGRRLAISLIALSGAHVLTYPVARDDWRSLAAAGLDVGGAVLLGLTATCLVRDGLARISARSRATDELEAHLRDDEVLLHKVTSAVAGIVAASHVLASDQRLDAIHRHRLERLLAAEQARLERLLSRAGDEPVSDVDLDAVLAPLVLSYRVRGLRVRWSPTRQRVRAKPDALAEVVDILLDNAATHSGCTHVDISISPRPGPVGSVELRITDDGQGIPRELLRRFRTWGTKGMASQGRGIGLCVAYRMVSEMGGVLDVLSDGRSGTTVAVSLVPSVAQPLATSEPAAELERIAERGAR